MLHLITWAGSLESNRSGSDLHNLADIIPLYCLGPFAHPDTRRGETSWSDYSRDYRGQTRLAISGHLVWDEDGKRGDDGLAEAYVQLVATLSKGPLPSCC